MSGLCLAALFAVYPLSVLSEVVIQRLAAVVLGVVAIVLAVWSTRQ